MKSSAVIGWIVKQQLFAFPKSQDVLTYTSQTSAHEKLCQSATSMLQEKTFHSDLLESSKNWQLF